VNFIKYIILLGALGMSLTSQAQIDEKPSLIERFKKKRAKRKAKKQAKIAYKEWEKNYKQRQRDHYEMQDSRTKKKMLDGQKQARRQASGRNHSWWSRMRTRL
tara:strand:- start:246 stop:554 length:309 start_codon:yes stop_codon:yes gene_type:complete